LHFETASEEVQYLGIAHSHTAEAELRVEGRDNVEVSCDDGESFSGSCFVTAPPEATVAVATRLRSNAREEGLGMVIVHPERGRPHYVAVESGSASVLGGGASAAFFFSAAAGGEPAGPIANGATFRGLATFEAVGADGIGELPVEGLPRVPIEVEVFPSAGAQVVTIREPAAALHPDGGFYGRLTESSLTIPAWRHIAASELSVPESEVVAQPLVRNLVATPELLAFDLEVYYGGFASNRPFYRLHVDLPRVGGTPAGSGTAPGPSYTSVFAASRAEQPTPWESRARELCAGGVCAPSDLSRFYCNENFSDDQGFATAALGTSGDARCEGGRALAPDYLLAIEDANSFSRFDLVDVCREELLAFDEAPTGGLDDLAARDCVHPLRWFGGVASTIDAVRNVATPPAQAARAARRNAQQLIETSGFVALEAVQATRYNNALGGDCGSAPCPTLKTLREYAVASQAVVEPFLHPRYAQYLESLASGQAEVDYATSLGAEPYSGPTISYSMLRASVAQLEILERAAKADHVAGLPSEAGGYASGALRKALLLRAFAAALAVQADEGSGLADADLEAFSAQSSLFAEAFGRVVARVVAHRQGANPLAIDDDSVPLYLDRDVESPEARAFALTNYLLDPSGSNWIGEAIERASVAQAEARSAWQSRIEAELAGLQIENDVAQYRSSVAREYGGRITTLCPVRDPDSGALLADADVALRLAEGTIAVDPYTCFIDTSDTECAAFAVPGDYSESEVHKDICMASLLRERTGLAGFDDPALGSFNPKNAFLDAIRGALSTGTAILSVERQGQGFVLEINGESLTVSEEEMRTLSYGVNDAPGTETASFGDFAPRADGVTNVGDYGAFVDLTESERICERQRSRTFGATPQVEPSVPAALDRAACYRGGLGEAALATRAAFTEVEASRARLEEHYQRYRVSTQTCALKSEANALYAAETAKFNEEVEDLQTASNWLGLATSVFGGASGAASGYANRKNNRTSGQALAGKASLGLGVLTAGLSIASHFVDAEIEEKEAAHEEYMEVIRQEAEIRECMNEASKDLVGLRTSSLEIVQAIQTLNASLLQFANLQVELQTNIISGVAALADATGPRTFAGAQWLDEALTDVESKMRLARRVTYLAALAVDYERQESNADGFRNRIIAAQTPAELDAVRQDMLVSTANRQIGNGTVGDAFAVVSLRDDIMALADQRDAEEGLATLSPAERFRVQLTDPKYAVYDGEEYLGQRIPFELVAQGATVNGPSSDLFSPNQCAERVWSVNAGIIGQEGVSGDATFTRLEMLKHNSFYSQWCRPEDEDTQFQNSGIRPSENLFLDPYSDGAFLDVPRTDPSSYSRAVLSNVRTDVARSDVERQEYAQGAQSGFAGRALFGQYAIFFPADSLKYRCANGEECGSQSASALDLSLVDDVLIRFDYVAGAKP
jgi:hypothetical protein